MTKGFTGGSRPRDVSAIPRTISQRAWALTSWNTPAHTYRTLDGTNSRNLKQ